MTARAKVAVQADVAEIERRRKASENYDALCRFEGIELSDDMRREVERLVSGEVTPDQCRANIIRALTSR